MYVNFKLAAQKGIHPSTILSLQLLKQNKTENLAETIENYMGAGGLEYLTEAGYVEFVKGKKTDSVYSLARLSKRGKELLELLETPEIIEDDITIFNFLAAKYKETEREIGNAKKTKLYIALFRAHTGIERNCLAILCNAFLEDEQNFQYSRKLEYLFFKPANVYEKFDIQQSKLYQFYLNRQAYFDTQFESL
jgi:hypothetical protein